MPSFETLLYSVEDGIATITLNRPDKLNAFNTTMMQELIAAFDETDADDNVKAVALKPGHQFLGACAAMGLAVWTVVATAGFGWELIRAGGADRTIEQARAASERANADLRARLDTAVVRMTATSGSP